MHFIAFTRAYLLEWGFRAIALLLSKQRNNSLNVGMYDYFFIEFQLDAEKLIPLHQVHPSHEQNICKDKIKYCIRFYS